MDFGTRFGFCIRLLLLHADSGRRIINPIYTISLMNIHLQSTTTFSRRQPRGISLRCFLQVLQGAMLALIRSCEDAEQIHRWYSEAVAYKKVGTCTRGRGGIPGKRGMDFFFVGNFLTDVFWRVETNKNQRLRCNKTVCHSMSGSTFTDNWKL